jgi:hypothetical protein
MSRAGPYDMHMGNNGNDNNDNNGGDKGHGKGGKGKGKGPKGEGDEAHLRAVLEEWMQTRAQLQQILAELELRIVQLRIHLLGLGED